MVRKPPGKIAGVSIEEFTSRIKNVDLNTYFIFGAIVLVLIIGVYALFSPESKNSRLGNPACGKIVVATDGTSLASNVSPTLSEARFFLVVNPLSKKLIETIRNPYRGVEPNPQIAYLIAGKGEEAVIVGNMDQQSYSILMQFGIRVFCGYQGQARKVIKLYRQARIAQSPQPTDNFPPSSPMMQAPQPIQGNAQINFAQETPVFVCPRCGQTANGQNFNGMYPICPDCSIQMQNMHGMGTNQPFCPLPDRMHGGAMQGGMTAGWGIKDIYNKGVMDGMGMGNNFTAGTQAAFGWGQQAFICPNCNWRMKGIRQGNNFPNCPNCASPMALDMSNENKTSKWWSEGQWAADMTRLRPQMNQMTNQPNFWQGPESTGFFLCPNCNWRMYAQKDPNDPYPRCPNCDQIMAQGGAYPQKQNIQNNAAAGFAGNVNFANQVAMTQNEAIVSQGAPQETRFAPRIIMPHEYRGSCTNCHQLGTSSGVRNNQNTTQNSQMQSNAMHDQNAAHVVIGGGR